MDQIVQASMIEQIARQLGKPVRMKTWSLIVTVFGDCILPRGGSISAISLGEIMQAMGIESGAVRTAISRLANEGVVERNKEGRTSFYRLAADQETKFREAALRIYPGAASFTGHHGDWAMVSIFPDRKIELPTNGTVRISRNWYFVNLDEVDPNEDVLVYRGNFAQMPVWFEALLAPKEEQQAMIRLINIFGELEILFEKQGLPDPLEALVLRCLLIHAWRKIALRLKGLPPNLLPDDWPESDCRNLVARLYEQLLERSENWLDEVAHYEGGKLPKAEYELYERFH